MPAYNVLTPNPARVPQTWRWSVETFWTAFHAGAFADARVELLDGEVFRIAGMSDRHYAAHIRVESQLRHALPPQWTPCVRTPLHLGQDTIAEPSLAVLPSAPPFAIPSWAPLCVELCDANAAFWRTRKLRLYACHNIPEYWLVNLQENQVERYLEPVQTSSGPTYRSTTIFQPGESLAPHFSPDAQLSVADLLPLP